MFFESSINVIPLNTISPFTCQKKRNEFSSSAALYHLIPGKIFFSFLFFFFFSHSLFPSQFLIDFVFGLVGGFFFFWPKKKTFFFLKTPVLRGPPFTDCDWNYIFYSNCIREFLEDFKVFYNIKVSYTFLTGNNTIFWKNILYFIKEKDRLLWGPRFFCIWVFRGPRGIFKNKI